MEQEQILINDIFDAMKKKALGVISPSEYDRYVYQNRLGDM